MGEETTQIASRFSNALKQLERLATDAGGDRPRAGSRDLEARVRDALDAVAAVYETATDAVRDWPAQRLRVLARIAAVREILDRSGICDESRQAARALIEAIGPNRAGR